MVSEGKFREDLYYRVNVIELRVPALRERSEDIPELIEAILRRQSKQLGSTLRITPAATEALLAYHFPGNVRELENILERAGTLCTRNTIDADDLQLRPRTPATESNNKVPSEVAVGEHLGDALEDIERDAIMKALEQTRFNKTKAAALLGMSFRSLRYRIKKLGLE
jgi:two-component system response regulator PilR (NtrC family)